MPGPTVAPTSGTQGVPFHRVSRQSNPSYSTYRPTGVRIQHCSQRGATRSTGPHEITSARCVHALKSNQELLHAAQEGGCLHRVPGAVLEPQQSSRRVRQQPGHSTQEGSDAHKDLLTHSLLMRLQSMRASAHPPRRSVQLTVSDCDLQSHLRQGRHHSATHGRALDCTTQKVSTSSCHQVPFPAARHDTELNSTRLHMTSC